MELSRRDAIVALTALGIGGVALGERRDVGTEIVDAVPTLVAVATVVYPTEIDVDQSFVETYVLGRAHARDDYEHRVVKLANRVNSEARRRFGEPMGELSVARRRRVLEAMGVHRADSSADGTIEQRFRYYVVNELLYALFTTAVGGQLIGMENPPGHPGGDDAYQRGPQE